MCWLATDTVSDPRALDPESQRLLEDEPAHEELEALGSVPLRPPVGNGARGLFRHRRGAGTTFPHDAARSRAYRWGEDGLLGITDRECRLCLAVALWNEHDPILKERLYGLNGNEGNHGEDVKELYYFLDATPTSSYLEALYKYPQRAFPYRDLLEENRRRGRMLPEYELLDTGVFDGNRYFDVGSEYAKAAPDDLWMRLTVTNRGPGAGAAARPAHALVPQHLGLGSGRPRATGPVRSCSATTGTCSPGTPRWGCSASSPRTLRPAARRPSCSSATTRPTRSGSSARRRGAAGRRTPSTRRWSTAGATR